MTTPSAEQFADLGDVTLCYQTFGDPADVPVVLVMGIATQMIAWRDDFCAQLADAGRFVVRFDNRDVGRSSRIDAPPPGGMVRMMSGRGAAYTIDDMAGDTIGLLDHLGLDTVHLVGVSMGGMIAQEVALAAPNRLRTLTIFASTPGQYHRGRPTWLSLRHPPTIGAIQALLTAAPKDRDGYIQRSLAASAALGVSGDEQDRADVIEIAGRAFDRGISRAGFARQFAAVTASRNRLPLLRDLAVPTLVLHGASDPVIRVGHGRATARAVPNSRLVVVPGLGHGLPRASWPRLLAAINALIDDRERVPSG